jgi:glycosyltransferase involved in cell wall biosynthesis
MRIVIDMQGAQTESRFRGIGRYTISLAQSLIKNNDQHQIFLVFNSSLENSIDDLRVKFSKLLPRDYIKVWSPYGPILFGEEGNDLRRDISALTYQAFIRKLKPDVFLISSFFEGYGENSYVSLIDSDKEIFTAVILYDLIPLLNPEKYLNSHPRYADFYSQKVSELKNVDGFLCISDATVAEGISNLNLPKHLFRNISAGCDDIFIQQSYVDKKNENILLLSLGIKRPYILYTGAADPRKNLPRLIRAFAFINSQFPKKYQLVLAGKMHESELEEPMAAAQLLKLDEESITYTGYLSNANLVILYRNCEVFVFPSLHEGFGLPALEAMSCGAPVIGSNSSSIPEVIGLKDALFDPLSELSILERLEQALIDQEFRKQLVEHGLLQAKKFSWDETAKKAIEALMVFYKDSKVKPIYEEEGPEELIFCLLDQLVQVPGIDKLGDDDLLRIASSVAHNFPNPLRMKKLFIDITELNLHDAGTGIQRVTRSVLKEFLVKPPEGYDVVAVFSDPSTGGYRISAKYCDLHSTYSQKSNSDYIEPQSGDIYLGLDFRPNINNKDHGYLKYLHRIGVQVSFVVYDLLPITHSFAFNPGAKTVHEEWLQYIAHFDQLLCISRAVSLELHAWLSKNSKGSSERSKIYWFHLGADLKNHVASFGFPENYLDLINALRVTLSFISVGTIEPRKGYSQLLDAFEILWQQGFNIKLVIVGKSGWLVEDLVLRLNTHAMLNKKLFWLSAISDEFLEKIYDSVDCLIAPSEGEGFGLPLIEAAQLGLPIIARKIEVFEEVAGKNAFYFDSLDGIDLANAIAEWMHAYQLNLTIPSNGMKWNSWADSAEQIKAILFENR